MVIVNEKMAIISLASASLWLAGFSWLMWRK